MRLTRALFLLAWLVACTPTSPSPVASPAASTPSPMMEAPTITEPSPPESAPVTIEGAGGLYLHGIWQPTARANAPAVLLLHMYAGDSTDWDPLATRLRNAGIASLAIDLRGHGATAGAEDWELARQDVVAAHRWLAGQDSLDPSRIAVLGASIGANLSLWLGAQQPDIAALLLLSPGFEYFRLPITGLIEAYGDRPIFLAASDHDSYSADTVRALAQSATGPVELVVYPAAGHGTDMLVAEPELTEEILGFLQEHLIGPP